MIQHFGEKVCASNFTSRRRNPIAIAIVRCTLPDRTSLHQAGEHAAHRAMATVTNETARETRIEKDRLGKPHGYTLSGRHVPVSISHSFPFAFAAASIDNVALGADVERIRDFAEHTWEAFLTPQEKEFIAMAPKQERERLRTLAWSLKESTLKALGVGIRKHPARIDTARALAADESSQDSIMINGVVSHSFVQLWKIEDTFIATTVALTAGNAYNAYYP